MQDMRGLVDPMLNYNWDFVVPNIPGGGDARSLTIKAASCNLPGVTLDVVPVTLHGVTLNYAGMERYGQGFALNYLETRDLGTRATLRNWIEYARNTRLNSGTEKSAYSTSVNLLMYDDVPSIARTLTGYGVWPHTLQEITLDNGGQAQAVMVQVLFAYDYHDEA